MKRSRISVSKERGEEREGKGGDEMREEIKR